MNLRGLKLTKDNMLDRWGNYFNPFTYESDIWQKVGFKCSN